MYFISPLECRKMLDRKARRVDFGVLRLGQKKRAYFYLKAVSGESSN